MPFEDLEAANKEIDRLSGENTRLTPFEGQVTELTTQNTGLVKERDTALELIKKGDEGAIALNETIGLRDASVEALQSQITEGTSKLDGTVSKESFDTLHTSFTTSLKARLKNDFKIPDSILEGKTIEQLQAMDEASSVVKPSTSSQAPMDPKGLGVGSDGNVNGKSMTPLESEMALIQKAKGQ